MNEKLRKKASAFHVAEREKKVKAKKNCLGGINLDFHYRNLTTVPGYGRATVGSGSVAPGGCDLM